MIRYWLMLRYWQLKASDELKKLYRMPLAGHSVQSLIDRNLSTLDLEHIEDGYQMLRYQVNLGIEK